LPTQLFQKGVCQNPLGRPKKSIDFKSPLIRFSWQYLLRVVKDKSTSESVKLDITKLIASKTTPQDIKSLNLSEKVIIIAQPKGVKGLFEVAARPGIQEQEQDKAKPGVEGGAE